MRSVASTIHDQRSSNIT